MIISRRRRYIFVHIPKTGGTAISLALEGRAAGDDILIGDTLKAQRRRGRLKAMQSAGRLWKHSRLADIHGVVSAEEMQRLFVLTLVRNPWDRLVSYYYWLREQSFEHAAAELATRTTFSEFLNDAQTVASISAADYASYVRDRDGTEQCNLFVRMENMEAELAPFVQHLGFDPRPIEPANTSDRDPGYRQYYSDKDAALVAQICATDIARFGYVF